MQYIEKMVIDTAARPMSMPAMTDGYLIIRNKNSFKSKMLEVNLKVTKGEKYLIASNKEMGIFTQGKNWNALMKNIKEAVELYFDIPSADVVKINLEISPMVNSDGEKASC